VVEAARPPARDRRGNRHERRGIEQARRRVGGDLRGHDVGDAERAAELQRVHERPCRPLVGERRPGEGGPGGAAAGDGRTRPIPQPGQRPPAGRAQRLARPAGRGAAGQARGRHGQLDGAVQKVGDGGRRHRPILPR
jgi:hypothetical protein